MRFFIILATISAAIAGVLYMNVDKTDAKLSVEVEEKAGEGIPQKHQSDIDIMQVLEKKCSTCHGKDKTKGNFDIVRLLNSGLKQDEIDYWNDVYRVINDGDMPPEDEEQLSDREEIEILRTLENKLKSSNDVTRLLTANEIINTLSDVFKIDAQNDNQMDNLYSYQDTEKYSTVDTNEIMSVFFMNDYSQILDGVINEYVKTEKPAVKKSKKKSDKKAAVKINNVGFASRSFIHEEGEFIDLRGRYSPHANAINFSGSRDLNLKPGKYKLSFKAAAFNRSAINKIAKDAQNGQRLLNEKAKVNIYIMPVYNKSRPSSKGKERQVHSFFIEDNSFKEYSIEVSVNRSTPIGLEFENGPYAGHIRRAVKGFPKENVPSNKFKYPYVRFKDFKLTPLSAAVNDLNLYDINEESVSQKLSNLIQELGVDIKNEDLLVVYKKQVESGISKSAAYKRAIKSVFLSPGFLYISNVGNKQTKKRFTSYSLLKSYPTKNFSTLYDDLYAGKLTQANFVRKLSTDSNFERFSNGMSFEWLKLSEMVANLPDEGHYKEFYEENLSFAFMKQTQLFFEHLFRKNKSVANLVESDFTFANDNLRRFYDLPSTNKTGFQLVELKDKSKGGVFTQGSFLAATSNGVEALPFRRAQWISENILNKQIPPPPDNISVQEFEEAKGTFAEKMKVHSTNKACYSCHKLIDPIADKMRYFDGIGKVEKHFKKEDVQPQVSALKEKYRRYTRKTAMAFCKNLISYSTGRKTDIKDYSVIESIVDSCEDENYPIQKILEGVVRYYF